MRVLRTLLLVKLGAWAGLLAAAAFMKRAVPSRGDDESDELALVAILGGIELASRAKSFRGGSMLSWFGGIAVDLREAELAPGARLSVNTLFGGVAIRTPPSWRVESKATSLFGGVDAPSPAAAAPDASVLTLEGLAIFGGIAVGPEAGPPDAAG
jgi:hypothetical protein